MAFHNCFMTVMIIIAYTLSVMVPSAIVLYPKVKDRGLGLRLSMYFIMGNTFASNLVFVLTFLHILYTPVVWICVIAFTVVFAFRTRQIPLKSLPVYIINFFIGLLGNDLGGRFASKQFFSSIGRAFASCGRWIKKNVLKRPVDTALLIVTEILLLYAYSQGLFVSYGYHASDVPVHNYWINEMVMHQKLFAGGLYPFGYHTVITYFFMIFRIPLMQTLSFFNHVIVLYTAFFMIVLGKELTRSRFAGYVGPFIYFGLRLFYVNCVNRYSAPLPQEFGIIFIFAGILFAIDFFRKNGKAKEETRQDEIFFALSVAMCLSSHLYTAIALLVACVAIAISRFTQFVRPSYFMPLIRAGVIGVIIAGWAIGIGFAMGIPMQGSANWARQVMEQQTYITADSSSSDSDTSGSAANSGSTGQAPETEKQKVSAIEKAKDSIDTIATGFADNVFYSTMDRDDAKTLSLYIIYAVIFFALFSFPMRIRDNNYGRDLLFISIYEGTLLIFFAAMSLGLKQLIDMDRAKEFSVIWLSESVGVWADAIITIIIGYKKKPQKLALDIISAAIIVAGGYEGYTRGLIRDPVLYVQMEKNGAIISLTGILRDNRSHSYTVVSANDELHMMETQGYHVEINELLRKIEKPDRDTSFTIPTSKVFFFVEKRPLTYFDIGMDQHMKQVSAEGARNALPNSGGLYVYMGDNRYTEMCRMYYFVRELMHRFPEHTQVYYDDDDFICVCLDQDMNSPMNLAFDYGYNK